MELGKFSVRGTLLECLEPNAYEFTDDRGQKRAGITRKAQIKFGRPMAELSVDEQTHEKLKKIPQYSDVDCLCQLQIVRDTGQLRVQLLDIRPAEVASPSVPVVKAA